MKTKTIRISLNTVSFGNLQQSQVSLNALLMQKIKKVNKLKDGYILPILDAYVDGAALVQMTCITGSK